MAAYALGRMYENHSRDLRNAIICYEYALQEGIAEAETALERCRNTLV